MIWDAFVPIMTSSLCQSTSSLFLETFILRADFIFSGKRLQSLTILCVNEWAFIVVSTLSFGSLGLRLLVVLPFIGMIRADSELAYMSLSNLYVAIMSPLSLMERRVGSESFHMIAHVLECWYMFSGLSLDFLHSCYISLYSWIPDWRSIF